MKYLESYQMFESVKFTKQPQKKGAKTDTYNVTKAGKVIGQDDAVKKIVDSGISADEVSEELIAQNLYHPEVPPIDLMIRSSGEQRISNFMLWRMAYAELYFTDKHWPEFDTIEFDKALEAYTKRNRRFGGN